ncbi:MAG: hypothetical protein K2Z81_04225 [Cyanobacteria bacterium]|nr:hypothetical protein [Cyanobacteriota bacterium]
MEPARQPNAKRVIPLSKAQGNPVSSLNQGKHARRVRIGRILLDAGLINAEKLQSALDKAKTLDQPIGKVLTQSQLISEKNLQSALLAQSMIQEGVVEERLAIQALKDSARSGQSFGELLSQKRAESEKSSLSLEDLLLESGMVSAARLQEAKKKSKDSGIPIGQCLVMVHAITFSHLNQTFECLRLFHQGVVSRTSAIKALSMVKNENADLSWVLKRQKITPRATGSSFRIGDLLTAGSVITEKDNLAAVEQAYMEKRLIGEILVGAGLLNDSLLKEALELQALVVKDVLDKEEAGAIIKQSIEEKKSIVEVSRVRRSFEDDAESATALDLLVKAKLIETDVVPQAMSRQAHYSMHALKALVASDVINKTICRAAIECARLVACGGMTPQEAVRTLYHCDRSRCDYNEAIKELGLELRPAEEIQRQAQSDWHQRLPQWSKSLEFRFALVAVVIAGIGAGLVIMLNPTMLAGYGILSIVFAIGLVFFTLGRSWETRSKVRRQQIQQEKELSQQTLSRLSKIKNQ